MSPRVESPARLLNSCSLTVVRSDTVQLSDGRRISLDAQSMATDGQSIIAVGSHAHIWPPGARRGAGVVDEGSTIGFLRDSAGVFHIVPTPVLPPSVAMVHIEYPRVAPAAAGGGWHMIFMVYSNRFEHAFPSDSAEIWYGRLDRSGWHDQQRLAITAGRLDPQGSSALIALGDDLYFAYPYDPFTSSLWRPGGMLLSRRGGQWHSDTVCTENSPSSVGLIADSAGHGVIMSIVEQPRVNGHSLASSIFLARFDSMWTVPRYVAGDGITPVRGTPSAGLLGRNRVFLSWPSASLDGSGARLDWAVVRGDSTATPHTPIAHGAGVEDNVAVVLGEHRVVWIGRDGSSRARLRLLTSDADAEAEDLGTLPIAIDNPRPWSIALSPSTFSTVTSKLGVLPTDGMVATVVSQILIACDSRTRGESQAKSNGRR
jgi:hypothetical protein